LSLLSREKEEMQEVKKEGERSDAAFLTFPLPLLLLPFFFFFFFLLRRTEMQNRSS